MNSSIKFFIIGLLVALIANAVGLEPLSLKWVIVVLSANAIAVLLDSKNDK